MTDTAPKDDLWAQYGAAYDAAFTEANFGVAQAALERSGLEAGMTVLDIAAGAGALSIPAARMGAEVLATDRSPAMLELLHRRLRAEGLTNVQTRVLDGSALDVGDRRFDRVCSEYGVMFFLEPGLAEMRRVMAPGGRAIVITWGDPERVPLTIYQTALARVLGPGAGPQAIPIVLDPGILGPAMEAAGFTQIDVFAHTDAYPATSPEQVWTWMRDVSPGYASIVRTLDADTQAALREAVLDETRERYGDRFEALPMEALVGIGR
jgi:ubiquinone/menaquinone biosynthesis C-methylase UbiE